MLNSDAARRYASKGNLLYWCPSCQRKNAIAKDGSCRYCAMRPNEFNDGRRELLEKWIRESPVERDPYKIFVNWQQP